jgi:hypothetical protein
MFAVYILFIWSLAAKQPTDLGHYNTAKECLQAAFEVVAKYDKAHPAEEHATPDTLVSIECRLGGIPKNRK